MKHFSKIIKGILLTAFFIGLFSLNINATENSGLADNIISTAYAADPPAAPDAPPLPGSEEEQQQELSQIQEDMGEGSRSTDLASGPADRPEGMLQEDFDREIAQAAGCTESEKPIYVEEEDTYKCVDTKEKEKINIEDILKQAAKASTFVNQIFNPLIHFLTFNIGNFLGNDYIFGGAMGAMLHKIWIVSRNIVNIVFVLVLLYIALSHIFGKDEQGIPELIKLLRIFVIMLIAVNFSWMASKLILDAANVATNVVFAIPSGVQGVAGEALPGECEVTEEKATGLCAPHNIYYVTGATSLVNYKAADCPSKEDVGRDNRLKTGTYFNKIIMCWNKMDMGKYNQNNASLHLSFSMARIQNLTRANTAMDIGKVSIGIIFTMLLQIVYLIAFFALYVVLIFRVAAMWIFVSFSPFIVLMLFFKQSGINVKSLENLGGFFSLEEFTKWAFAPAKVGAVWAVGFIMVTAGQTMNPEFFNKISSQGEPIKAEAIGIGSLFLGMDNIQEFIWLLMTIGIIWTGTFAMMADLHVVKGFTEGINNYGKTLARYVGTSPKWAPIIPKYNAKTGKMEMTSFKQSGLNINRLIEDYQRKSGSMSVTQKFNLAERDLKGKMGDLHNLPSSKQQLEFIEKHTNNLSRAEMLDPAYKEKFVDALEGAGATDAQEIVDGIHRERAGLLTGTAPTGGDKGEKKAEPEKDEPKEDEPTRTTTGSGETASRAAELGLETARKKLAAATEALGAGGGSQADVDAAQAELNEAQEKTKGGDTAAT